MITNSIGVEKIQTSQEGRGQEKLTMREKYKDASTGPDFYFEKALQAPSLSFKRSSNKRKFVLLPSSMRTKSDGGQYSFASRTTLNYHSWHPVNKDLHYSPIHSPGSNATSKTSICTDDSYNEDDDDTNSYCGSLTYSVESWTVEEPYPSDEIDDGYHAEDDDTICTTTALGCSAYNLDHSDGIDAECFGVDVCFQPLDWLRILIKETFQTLGSIHEDESGPRSQLRLARQHNGPA